MRNLEEIVVPPTLKLMIIDEERIGDLIARQWFAETSGELQIENWTTAQLTDAHFEIPVDVDAVIYPTGMLGELESRNKLLPMSRKIWQSSEYKKDELLRIYRTSISRHRNEMWGVPLGGSMFTLVFDRTIVGSLNRDIPEDWETLRQLIEKKIAEPESQFRFKMPLAKNWAAQIFLARVAPLIRSRGRLSTVFERSSMQPLINSTPFIFALNDIKSLMGNDESQLELTPAQLFQEIVHGKTAMGLTWPTPPQIEEETDTAEEQLVELAFASLPGSNRWFDNKGDRWIKRAPDEDSQFDLFGFNGLIGSLSSGSRNTNEGFRFLAWLGNKATPLKTLVYSQNSGPFRASHLGNPSLWCDRKTSNESARQFADVIDAAQSRDVILMFPRIPNRHQYLSILDENIRECLKGTFEVEECLNKTATQWDEITDRFGRDQMIEELAKDAGL